MQTNNTAGNSNKTVAIRGERTIISPDESWLKHVEEQGAKGAGTFGRTDEQREADRKANKRLQMSRDNGDRRTGGANDIQPQ